MNKILIIEDDRRINEGVKFNLELDGFTVFTGFTLEEGKSIFFRESIDLIILDINLSDGNGFDFCLEIKEKYSVPIIFLSANDMEMDQIRGFKMGCDDYVTKPFSIAILTQRVMAILRRNKKDKLVSGEYVLDFDKRAFYKNKDEIVLSPTEFKIIKKLMENEDKVISRDEILSELWDENGEFVYEHTLTVNINRLRNKLNDNKIKTVYKKGYMWSLKDE
ncbi:MAG: response regulator transcription factor [Clostridium sp.]